jgi:23S rRNA (guanosine2251-2'-O)-methyltransferase
MEEKNTLIYGHHPVAEAIKAAESIDKVMIQQGMRGEMETEIRFLCKERDIPLQYVPKEKLNKLTKGNHQGLVAYVSSVVYHHAEDLIEAIQATIENPFILLLDGVTDVRNVGAIARSAECAGADAIIVQQKKAGQFNAEAMKASAGALAKIRVGRVSSFSTLIATLQNNSWQVIASDLKATKQLMDVDFKQPTAVIIGSEGEGVSKYLLKAADETFIIPQVGETDSFNVSVATGIILYEAMRQKMIG